MTSKVKTEKRVKEKYPKLMVVAFHRGGPGEDGTIVLFSESGVGVVVGFDENFNHDESKYRLGEFCDHWEMSFFKPFNGVVTLSN